MRPSLKDFYINIIVGCFMLLVIVHCMTNTSANEGRSPAVQRVEYVK